MWQLKEQLPASRQDDRALDDILQFAHVAGPIVVLQVLQVEFAQARARDTETPGGLFNEMVGEQPQVLQPLTQWRHFDGKDTEPIVQVEPEASGLGLGQK